MKRMRKVFAGLVGGLLVVGVPGAAHAEPGCGGRVSCEVFTFGLWSALLALPFWFVATIVAAAVSRSLRTIRPHLLALPFALIGAALFVLLGGELEAQLPLAVRFSRWVLLVEGTLAAMPTVAWYLVAARRARAASAPASAPDGPRVTIGTRVG